MQSRSCLPWSFALRSEKGVKRGMATQGFLLNGRWVTEGNAVQIQSPFNDSIVGKTYEATAEQLEEAIAGAVRSFGELRLCRPRSGAGYCWQ
jgi:delta 1-pyrroline-5-carboxylate dehydrogenase